MWPSREDSDYNSEIIEVWCHYDFNLCHALLTRYQGYIFTFYMKDYFI